jgi:hypothetical protein
MIMVGIDPKPFDCGCTLSIDWLIDWLIDCDGVRLTSQNRGHHWPTVHPPGKCEWRAVVMMLPAGDNSWLVLQSSLALLPAETSGASKRNGRRNQNVAYSISSIHRSHTKEGVLRIFIALKNPSLRPGLNPRPLGPVASTLITTPPRRLLYLLSH